MFAAAEELLLERGYHGFGLQAVARRAGVGHASVYRRWPSKAHLVHELLYPIGIDFQPPPHAGDLPALIRSLVDGTVATYSRPAMLAATPGLLADFHADPDLRPALQDRVETGFRKRLHELMTAMVEAGDVRPGLSTDALLGAISGAVLFALYGMSPDRGLGPDFAAELTDLLLYGAAPRPQ